MEGSGPIDWFAPLAFLAMGVVLGAIVLWRVRRRGAATAPVAEPVERRDLAEKRDVLIRQLRELEDTAAKRNPEQLATERYSLELEAAHVLRALEVAAPLATRTPTKTAAVPSPAAAPSRPALRGFLWGTGSAAALGLLLYFVSESARPRVEGDTVTGNTPMGGPPDTVARNPGDVEARLDLARSALGRQDMMAVWKETQEVLAKSPGHPRALAYQSLVRLAMGQSELALDMLKTALKTDPNLLEGYIHLSLVYARMGRAKESDAAMAEAIRRFPDQAAMLREAQEEIRKAPAETAVASGGENPHEGVGAPGSGATGGATPVQEPPLTAPSGHRVGGVVDLDPGLKGRVPAGSVVFLTLREAGFGAGPPIAAKRFVASTFPIPFEISDADSMRGDPLPKEVLLEARADSDGDPMTRSPEDPSARQDDIKIGTADVRLVLKRK